MGVHGCQLSCCCPPTLLAIDWCNACKMTPGTKSKWLNEKGFSCAKQTGEHFGGPGEHFLFFNIMSCQFIKQQAQNELQGHLL